MRNALTACIATTFAILAPASSAFDSSIPATGLPSASQFSASVLPEQQGIVSWKTLAQVEPVKRDGRMVPEFAKEILGLDKRQIRIQGFILPMDLGDKQKHFLISAVPPHCPFCLPAGPDAVVEVLATKPVTYGFEPVVLEGKLAVLKDDPNGLLYRLSEATLIASH
jgi:hypothetical protein